MLDIKKEAKGSALKITLEGRLDTTTCPSLEAALEGAFEGVTDLKFDFEKLSYISSAGLRVLLSSQKVMIFLIIILLIFPGLFICFFL